MNIEWIDARKRLPAREMGYDNKPMSVSVNVLGFKDNKEPCYTYYSYVTRTWLNLGTECSDSVDIVYWAYIPLPIDDEVDDLPVEDTEVPEGYYK
jgi:hypothetical protein